MYIHCYFVFSCSSKMPASRDVSPWCAFIRIEMTEEDLCITCADFICDCSSRRGCVVTVSRARAPGRLCLQGLLLPVALASVGCYCLQEHLLVAFTLFLLVVCCLGHLLSSLHREEVVLVSGVGVQVTRTYCCGCYSSAVFVPSAVLLGVCISEAVSMFTVYFYLTLMVGCHGNEGDCHGDGCKPSDDMKLVKLVPLFTCFHTKPRLKQIEHLYHKIRATFMSAS